MNTKDGPARSGCSARGRSGRASSPRATLDLADIAKDAIPGAVRRELAVEVREHTEHALLKATLGFELTVHA
jgi:hypothetical protein